MSWVTDVLLLFSLDETWVEFDDQDESVDGDDEIEFEHVESQALLSVNAWLSENGYGQLINLDDHAFKAGDKAMQASVYGGAFNFLDVDGFINVVKSQAWHSPQDVQLLVKTEQETRFSLYTIESPEENV